MSDLNGVWTCPSCARRVPNRVTACRCGFQQADVPPPLPVTAEPADNPGPRRLLFLVAGVLVAGVIGLIAVPAFRPAASPVPVTTPAAPTASEPPAETEAAAE